MRGHYKRLPDLFVQGEVVELAEGQVMYVRVLNPFEHEEARMDAQAAKARLAMALREHGSNERAVMDNEFEEYGRETVIHTLVRTNEPDRLMRAVTEIRDDPDWKERLAITDRQEELVSRPTSDPERKLLDQINREYMQEVEDRLTAGAQLERERLDAMDDDLLRKEFFNRYVEQRGNELATAEFNVTQLWYGTRVCSATRNDDGDWDHATCDHEQVFESKAEVRDLPRELVDMLLDGFQRVSMTVREAKNSDRQGSSSGSSPLPSEEEASTASTPAETPAAAPGT